MSLHERLEEVFQTALNDDEITLADETTPADIPGLDSLAHINLMFSIEEAFGVSFVDSELAGFESVGELKRILISKGCV